MEGGELQEQAGPLVTRSLRRLRNRQRRVLAFIDDDIVHDALEVERCGYHDVIRDGRAGVSWAERVEDVADRDRIAAELYVRRMAEEILAEEGVRTFLEPFEPALARRTLNRLLVGRGLGTDESGPIWEAVKEDRERTYRDFEYLERARDLRITRELVPYLALADALAGDAVDSRVADAVAAREAAKARKPITSGADGGS